MSNLEQHPNFVQRAQMIQKAAEGRLENFGKSIATTVKSLDLGNKPFDISGIYKK